MGFRKKYRIFYLFIYPPSLSSGVVNCAPLRVLTCSETHQNSSAEMSLLILLAVAALHGNFCCCFLTAVASSHAKRASASAESGEIQDRPWRKTEKERQAGRIRGSVFLFSFSFSFSTPRRPPPPPPTQPPTPHPHGPSALNVKEQSAGETDSRRRCEWDD